MNSHSAAMDNSLQQYLDLYDANSRAIDAGCGAPLLNAMRPGARSALEGARLPERGDEGYERTSVNDMLAPDSASTYRACPCRSTSPPHSAATSRR